MGQKYLIDTNVIIDAQMAKIPDSGMNFLKSIINSEFNVSFITYIEFLGYKNISNTSTDFISLANIIEVNKNIIHTCIELRKSVRIKLPDAIIAATAVSEDFTLITHNHKDFAAVKQLKVIDPYSII